MKSIVFMGGKEIGYTCLEHLVNNAKQLDYSISCALINDRMLLDQSLSLKRLCQKNSIPTLHNLEEFEKHPVCDIIISVQYHEILKQRHIDKADELAINLHMAPVPEYRGCNQFSFAIIDRAKEFGTTLHKMETEIDAGDVLFEERFPVPEGIFVKDLYEITFNHSVALFKKSLPNIISGNYQSISQKELAKKRPVSYHYRNEINEIKQINPDWPIEKQKRYFRATFFPPFPPPTINSEKLDKEWYRDLK